MCVEQPLGQTRPLWLPELNALAAFKVVEKRGGVHVARRGAGSFTYPLHALRIDPNAEWGHHERCLHFAFDQPFAEANLIGAYGSHILFCALLPHHFWSRQSPAGACLHGDLTVPLACLSCGEGGYEPDVTHPSRLSIGAGSPIDSDMLAWARQLPVVSQ